jgi:hypothetical protein
MAEPITRLEMVSTPRTHQYSRATSRLRAHTHNPVGKQRLSDHRRNEIRRPLSLSLSLKLRRDVMPSNCGCQVNSCGLNVSINIAVADCLTIGQRGRVCVASSLPATHDLAIYARCDAKIIAAYDQQTSNPVPRYWLVARNTNARIGGIQRFAR